jgi:heme exporter protein A
MLQASGLHCRRGGRDLFKDVSFELKGGDLLRIGGANGSGKTSLLRVLCGLLAPAAGEVRWKGEPIRSLREDYSRNLLYLGHAPAVKDDLTAAENLRFAGVNGDLRLPEEIISSSLASLGVPGDALVRTLSQGQKRRAALARLAVSGSVPLWLLDEPFTALDKDAAALVEELIRGHAAAGGAVVYTTHQDARLEATRTISLDG